MKVILVQDVPGLGGKWEIKNVKGGYLRNYLLPRKLVVLATSANLKEIELKKKQEAQKKALEEDLFEKSLASLEGSTIVIEKKVNEKGHLFDGVDVKEIADFLKEKLKFEIPIECIKLEKTIKEVGKHKITVRRGDREAFFEIEIKSSNQ